MCGTIVVLLFLFFLFLSIFIAFAWSAGIKKKVRQNCFTMGNNVDLDGWPFEIV